MGQGIPQERIFNTKKFALMVAFAISVLKSGLVFRREQGVWCLK